MKDICQFQCNVNKKNEFVSSYALHAGAGTNYKLISISKYLLDFTSLQVKSYKRLQIYENEHFQLGTDQHHVYFSSGIMVYSNTCNL